MDAGKEDTYWVDVMIEKGWETTMGQELTVDNVMSYDERQPLCYDSLLFVYLDVLLNEEISYLAFPPAISCALLTKRESIRLTRGMSSIQIIMSRCPCGHICIINMSSEDIWNKQQNRSPKRGQCEGKGDIT